MSGIGIQPRRGLCIVLCDEREEVVGGGLIHLPQSETSSEKLSEGVGTIVALYAYDKTKALVVYAGMRVAFRSYLKNANVIPTDEVWESGSKKQYFFLDLDDLVGEVGPSVKVGVFSSPASHAIPKNAFDEKKE